jgi:hypothetical protein
MPFRHHRKSLWRVIFEGKDPEPVQDVRIHIRPKGPDQTGYSSVTLLTAIVCWEGIFEKKINIFLVVNVLRITVKGHSYENVCEIIALSYSLGLSKVRHHILIF